MELILAKEKPSRISYKVDKDQLKVRLTELGFYK